LLELKKKERKIADRLSEVDDIYLIKQYQTELEIIWLQRKKGVAVLQQLKQRKKK
jgi:hypothetical protein